MTRRLLSLASLFVVVAVLVTATMPAGAAPLAQESNPGTGSLIAWWSLNETSGSRADSHSNALTLTDNNTVTQAAGVVGNAASFASANDEYLSRTSSTLLQAGDIQFTVCVWIYPTTLSGNIVSKGLEWRVLLNSNGSVDFINADSGTTMVSTSASAVTTNTWQLLCVWHDSVANQAGISINTTATTASYSAGLVTTTNPWLVGGSRVTPILTHYNGRMDELVFYKKVLGTTERAWLYNSGAGRAYADLSPTATPVPPTATNTPLPSTNTPLPPTNTPLPPTNTPLPPTATNTPLPPTATDTPLPGASNTPTATAEPPTATPTETPLPPTATSTPTAISSDVLVMPIDGTHSLTVPLSATVGDVMTTTAIMALCGLLLFIVFMLIFWKFISRK